MSYRDFSRVDLTKGLGSDITAFVAQLGERKTEDLKVRGSIPRGGIFLYSSITI